MARHVGNDGDASFGGNIAANVTNWSLQTGINTANSAAKGQVWDTHSTGRKNWSGTVTCEFDNADTAQAAMVAGASLAVILRVSSAAGAATFAGTATLVGDAYDSPEDEAAYHTKTANFLGNGALTIGTVGGGG
jgi:hypothetical protein